MEENKSSPGLLEDQGDGGHGDTINGAALCFRPCELSDVFKSSSYVPLRPTTHVGAAERGGQLVGGHGFPRPEAEVQEEPSCPLQARTGWMSPAGEQPVGRAQRSQALIESK